MLGLDQTGSSRRAAEAMHPDLRDADFSPSRSFGKPRR
jgi:hypothetical protein